MEIKLRRNEIYQKKIIKNEFPALPIKPQAKMFVQTISEELKIEVPPILGNSSY